MSKHHSDAEHTDHIGKGRPTPSRKEAQARNAQPLVGNRSKEARKAERARMAELRAKARQGLAEGDERYLTPRDAGKQRRFARDWIDARWNVGEFIIPAMFVVLITTFFPEPIPYYGIIAMWVYVAVSILDLIIASSVLKKRLREKFGSAERGVGWYASMRALQFRMLRLPKPQVRRGEFPKI